jgi:hypothetical protein
MTAEDIANSQITRDIFSRLANSVNALEFPISSMSADLVSRFAYDNLQSCKKVFDATISKTLAGAVQSSLVQSAASKHIRAQYSLMSELCKKLPESDSRQLQPMLLESQRPGPPRLPSGILQLTSAMVHPSSTSTTALSLKPPSAMQREVDATRVSRLYQVNKYGAETVRIQPEPLMNGCH